MGLLTARFQFITEDSIYAIIRAGGRQYRVRPDQTLDVDLLTAEAGSTVEFGEVLLIGGDGDMQIGYPFVDGARVMAEVLEHGRDRKILVFKYKNKTRYRRRHGHRQGFTRLAIRQILTDGREVAVEEEKQPARPSRKRTTPKPKPEPATTKPEAAAVEAVSEAETPVADAAAKPKRPARARKTTPSKAKGSAEAADTATKKPAPRARAKKTETGD